jgi:hypothetical protein
MSTAEGHGREPTGTEVNTNVRDLAGEYFLPVPMSRGNGERQPLLCQLINL